MEFLTQIETDEGDSTIASLSIRPEGSEDYFILATCINMDVANLIVKAFQACQKESNEDIHNALSKVVAQVA